MSALSALKQNEKTENFSSFEYTKDCPKIFQEIILLSKFIKKLYIYRSQVDLLTQDTVRNVNCSFRSGHMTARARQTFELSFLRLVRVNRTWKTKTNVFCDLTIMASWANHWFNIQENKGLNEEMNQRNRYKC